VESVGAKTPNQSRGDFLQRTGQRPGLYPGRSPGPAPVPGPGDLDHLVRIVAALVNPPGRRRRPRRSRCSTPACTTLIWSAGRSSTALSIRWCFMAECWPRRQRPCPGCGAGAVRQSRRADHAAQPGRPEGRRRRLHPGPGRRRGMEHRLLNMPRRPAGHGIANPADSGCLGLLAPRPLRYGPFPASDTLCRRPRPPGQSQARRPASRGISPTDYSAARGISERLRRNSWMWPEPYKPR